MNHEFNRIDPLINGSEWRYEGGMPAIQLVLQVAEPEGIEFVVHFRDHVIPSRPFRDAVFYLLEVLSRPYQKRSSQAKAKQQNSQS